MNILILGVNGFIGSHLAEAILAKTDWHITAIDLSSDKINHLLSQDDRFHFQLGDITKETNWIEKAIQACDVVLPLVAIATPITYVQNPIRVFELDFEANLAIVRLCMHYHKRIIFPSTSEVYGMCTDTEFDEKTSHLVTGPIHKKRWIYSASKQLLDRLIYAYGESGLAYTLFRPFNWYGPRLDNVLNPKPGGSRVLTQFIGNILRGESISLVNGGSQQRCFTYIDDGIDALLRIIENKDQIAHQRVFNIGNPVANISIRELAETLIQLIIQHYPAYAEKAKAVQLIEVDAKDYFGEGYQDVALRVPAVRYAREYLNWQPTVNVIDGLRKTLDYYLVG